MDGAERILSTILPSSEPEMASLLKEAQLEILEAEYGSSDRDRLCQLLVDGLIAQSSPDASEAKFRALATTTLGGQTNRILQAALRTSLTRENLLGYFHDSYAVNPNLDPKAATQSLARSTRVIGAMLEQLADEYNVGNSPTRWLSRLARAFWALVEVAVPHSVANLIVLHWLKLLYLFEGLLIFGGTLFAEGTIQRFGFVTLAVTLGTHLAVLTIGDVMRGRHRWLRIAGILAVPLLLALGVGVYALLNDSVRNHLSTQLLLQLRP